MTEKREGYEYGRTVADALAFLDRAAIVMVRVPVGPEDFTYLSIPLDALRHALQRHGKADPMPCHFWNDHRELAIGSLRAIEAASGVTP